MNWLIVFKHCNNASSVEMTCTGSFISQTTSKAKNVSAWVSWDRGMSVKPNYRENHCSSWGSEERGGGAGSKWTCQY